jgi:hypothetical protein
MGAAVIADTRIQGHAVELPWPTAASDGQSGADRRLDGDCDARDINRTLTVVSQTVETAPHSYVRIGHLMDPDLRIRIPALCRTGRSDLRIK